jgi:geranylgeranyl diphosphate synthase, type II
MAPTPAATTDSRSATEILRLHAAAVEGYLLNPPGLAAPPAVPSRLAEAMTYSLKAGGKRLRPALVLEAAVACGGGLSPAALSAAAAIEMVHTFSLIHDDLPAMDDDDLRRGQPTNHKVFGEAMAILAGDALSAAAFELLSAVEPAETARALVRELAVATGPAGMIGGQVLDMEGEGRKLNSEDLHRLHAMKTGALLTASVRMGCLAAGGSAEQLASLTAYGRAIGLAFQIADDLLDVTATPDQMGKATGKDSAGGKNTFPALFGLEASVKMAQEHVAAGLAAIDPFGRAGAGLASLARFITSRSS